MGNTTLRELAKQHASGELNKQDYRQQRKELINHITGYQEPLESIPPPFQSDTPFQSSTPFQSNSSRAAVIGRLSIIIVVLAALAMIVYYSLPGNNKPSSNTKQKNADNTIRFTWPAPIHFSYLTPGSTANDETPQAIAANVSITVSFTAKS